MEGLSACGPMVGIARHRRCSSLSASSAIPHFFPSNIARTYVSALASVRQILAQGELLSHTCPEHHQFFLDPRDSGLGTTLLELHR